MSIVSAENTADAGDVNTVDNEIASSSDLSSTEIIKKENNNVSKTSTSTSKTASKISINSQSVKYDTTTNFSAKVTDKNGKSITEGKVVFKINGKTIGTAPVNKGTALLTYKLTDMTPKTYDLSVKYGENSKYLGSSANTTLTLLKHNSRITANNASVISRDTVSLTVNVIDADSGSAAKSGKVAFKLNGKTVGHANVSNGVARYSYKATKLSAKMYNFTATFGGNSLLNPDVSKVAFLNVSAIPTRMSVNAISGYSDSVVLKATVVEKSISKYLPSGVVVFKINDKTIGNATISEGKVHLTYNTTELARGNYKISAILKPTSTYASSEASNNLTIKVEDYFTYSQIKSAAVYVRNQFESNHSVSTVYIGKSRMALSEFLALMIQSAKNVNKGKSSENVYYKYYKSLTTQKDSLTKGTLTIKEVLEIGDKVYSYMQENNKPPVSVSTSLGTMGFLNVVYTYTRVLDVSATTYLPSTCRVYNWNSIHPASSTSRTIYITSDVIYNTKRDRAIMECVKSTFESYGYTAVLRGYGPNSHCGDIWSKVLPDNAVQVSIFSGADAGVIYDFSTRSFMRTKENRLIFFVYDSNTSKDITNLTFLERAWDDNYSAKNFIGIDYPDIYLKSHGYDYAFDNNIDNIVRKVIDYIT